MCPFSLTKYPSTPLHLAYGALLCFLAFGSGLAFASDLQALSDEFDSSATLPRWNRLYETEGWGVNQLEQWDINTTTNGAMYLMPYTSSWFDHFKGVLVYKEIEGDFVCSIRMNVGSRADIDVTPGGSFSLAGIFVRAPTGRTAAAPNPIPPGLPEIDPFPSDTNSPSYYETDWAPFHENYLFLSYGAAGDPGTRQYEVKSTTDSYSFLYYRSRGVPASGLPDSGVIELQCVFVGQTALVLRRHLGGEWIIENRYTVGASDGRQRFPDFDHDNNAATPNRYQVGITTYTDWSGINSYINNHGIPGQYFASYTHITNATPFSSAMPNPDLQAAVDYIHYARPNTNLTEALLQSLTVDYLPFIDTTNSTPLALLSGSAAAPYLGDNAHRPVGPTPPDPFDADTDAGGLSDGLEYAMGQNYTNDMEDVGMVQSVDTNGLLTLEFPIDDAVAPHVNLLLERSDDLSTNHWTLLAERPAGVADWSTYLGATLNRTDDGAVTFSDTLTVSNLTYRVFRLRATPAP